MKTLTASFFLLVALYSFKVNAIVPSIADGHAMYKTRQSAIGDTTPSVLGSQIIDFSLKNVDNATISLNQFKDAKGFIIVFTCNHCPFAKLYSQRYNDLNKKYKPLGVPLIAINSMDSLVYEEESFEAMQEHARAEKFNFPYLQDDSQCVGKNFNAEHTPQAYVIWKEKDLWVIKYSGSIDDNGAHQKKATPFIALAVNALLKNKPVTKPNTESFGCRIFYRK